jgi:hypothetical protein
MRLISGPGLPKLGTGHFNWQRILIVRFREAEYSEHTTDHLSQQIVQPDTICVNLRESSCICA